MYGPSGVVLCCKTQYPYAGKAGFSSLTLEVTIIHESYWNCAQNRLLRYNRTRRGKPFKHWGCAGFVQKFSLTFQRKMAHNRFPKGRGSAVNISLTTNEDCPVLGSPRWRYLCVYPIACRLIFIITRGEFL